MAGGRFSGLFRWFFEVGINIRPAEHGGGWVDGGEGGGQVSIQTVWSSYDHLG